MSEARKMQIKGMLEKKSIAGIYKNFMEDVLVDHDAVENSAPLPSLVDQNEHDVLKRYQNFKKFDIVTDHSDHLIGARNKVPMYVESKRKKEEWEILKRYLPERVFVRAYASRDDILRAVIIGAQGTPYHDALFFFDVQFPFSSTSSSFNFMPSVRYHSYGLQINPEIYMCGQVALSHYKQTSNGSFEWKDMWVQGTSNMLELFVLIRDVFLTSNPLFNTSVYRKSQVSNGQERSVLYNENTIIKSLLSMIYTMNKPPKNFEDFVTGHFRNRARHILMACKGYIEGGFLEGIKEEGCSITFRNDVASCIKPLVDAFIKIGAKEAKEFLPLSEIKFPLHDEQNLKKGVVSSGVTKRKSTNDGDHTAKKACFGNTGSISNSTQVISSLAGMPTMNELSKSLIKKLIERNSSVGIYSMDDVTLNQNDDDAYNSIMARLDNIEDVEKRYKSFKKFDTVVDHSDHLFSAHSLPTKQPLEIWVKTIHKERTILEKDLPDGIFVRVYEPRTDLMRAMIIGPEGTPYHDALFFFDVCFPSTYPGGPPLVRYRSGGLGINPNVYKCGEVCMSLLKTSGRKDEKWVPDTSSMLQVLVSIQGLILNAAPFFNRLEYRNMIDTMARDRCSLLYNENTIINSLKTMVYTINKPPKHFEDIVVGHFRNRALDILLACKVCLESDVQEEEGSCAIMFKNDVVACIKPLVDAFYKIGVHEASEFLPLSGKKNLSPDANITIINQ